MKHFLFSIVFFLLHAGAMFAQVSSNEVLSSESSYLPYQDSLLILRTITITTTELDGVNDTLVSYSEPTDSAGLAIQLTNAYLNDVNTKAARLRNASPMRFFLQDYINSKNIIESLGQNLDSLIISQYKRHYLGTWRVFMPSGSQLVELTEHPNRSDLLRMTGDNFTANIQLYGRHHLRLTIARGNASQGQSYFLNWNGASRERPVYEDMKNVFPAAVSPRELFRIVKIR